MAQNSTASAGDAGSTPGSGRSSGEGKGNPLQYSCLENPMTGEPGRLHTIHGIENSQMGVCDSTTTTIKCRPIFFKKNKNLSSQQIENQIPVLHQFTSDTGGFPGGSEGKESACSEGDSCSIPGPGRSPGEGNGNPLQYSGLKNPVDRGA